ncbi:MAG: transglycosylase SLT domain-containing protein, partial [Pseudomonas sp.]
MRFTAPFSKMPFRGALILLLTTLLVACQSSPPSSHSKLGQRADGSYSAKPRETIMLRSARGPGAVKAEEVHTLWGRIRHGFMLEPGSIDNPRIDQQRLSFLSQPRYFELTSVRAERYLHYVVEQLDARSMPLELALLPFVESGYNPMAYSRSHAAGIWQFIPSTGEYFSLRQDWWYDGRRDITAS